MSDLGSISPKASDTLVTRGAEEVGEVVVAPPVDPSPTLPKLAWAESGGGAVVSDDPSGTLPTPDPSGATLPKLAWAESGGGAVADWVIPTQPKKGGGAGSDASSLTTPFLLGFGSGTVMNDAAASCWFNFLFIFLEVVQRLNGTQVGIVFLSGQFADALSTPIIGILADKSAGLFGLGRRQTFYLMGACIVACSFTFVFAVCLPCVASSAETSDGVRTISFAVAAAVFNIGWAAAQNSHQSLVPEITPHESERVALNSARYASFVLSNLLVLLSMFGLISGLGDTNPLTYKALTGIVLGTGAVCAIIFLAVVRTPSGAAAGGRAGVEVTLSTPPPSKKVVGGKGVYDWLKDPNLYKTAVVYITMRIASNLTTLYMALFVVQTLGMNPTAIADIPFVIFASSLLTVPALKRLTERVGVRGTLTLGAAVFACGGVGILSAQRGPQANVMYAVAAALGVGLAGLTVSTATLQSELLGEDTLSAGFVFGIMSAVDKLVVGLLVFGLQLASDSLPQQQQVEFFRYTLGAGPMGAALLCVLVAWTLPPNKAVVR